MPPKPKTASSQQPAPPVEDLFTTLNRHIHSRHRSRRRGCAPMQGRRADKNDRVGNALSAIRSSPTTLDDFHFLKAPQFPLSSVFSNWLISGN
ncbi:hypothetical protein RJT34_02768 [Clitoria ternatea]|uniref:Uncharacterized protein n=1 Tax=Clitoria ternatea TaxID=43366 RepID=A0AAN9KHM8_CLITE